MNRKLKVIIWKNLIVRKRHWFLTLCESLLPVLFFVLLAFGRSKINYLGRVDIGATHNYKEIIDYIPVGLNLGETQIYYAPKTPFNSEIIHSVQEKFSIINNNVRGFSNEQSLLDYFEATGNNETLVAVIFHSENSTRLDYSLSYHQKGLKWETESLYNSPYDFEPGMGTHYRFRGYLQLQLAIDKAYIEKISQKQTENIYVAVQEFPYPPHKVDKGLTPMFYHFLPLVTLMSFIFVCPAIIQRVVAEKDSGMKELVKMVGMRSWMLWLSWFLYSIAPMLISVLIIVFCLKVPIFGSDLPVIEHTSTGIVFIFLMLYVFAACISALFLSTLFNKPTLAMLVGLIYWILSYFVPIYALDPNNNGISKIYNLLMMLFPNTALYFGYSNIALFEEREIGINWKNICTPPDDAADTVSMANVFYILAFDCLIYMILTFYFDAVNPGKYGVKQSLFYPITYLFKLCKKHTAIEDDESMHLEVMEKGEFSIGVQLENVSKKFKGRKYAVCNLSLDIYRDQITVLLGHNGAGKSTTIGLITGMLRKTAGKIYINGKETNSRSALKNSIGLCTQHNLFFPDLTVREHLEFFAMLKGKLDQDEVTKLLEKLCLTEKANNMAHTLSGGMKRKLCLGMAVIGDSKILILDEPSSGMDPESRREMWDLLLTWRKDRTILITTHFMDEADALGDWIAIMEEGKLRCFGTPMTLKKKYDTGYHLKLLINEKADVNEAVDRLKKKIEEKISKDLYDNITYCKPDGNEIALILHMEKKYTKLLEILEENKRDLQIDCMSFTSTTLEDVFLGLRPRNTDDDKSSIDNFNMDTNKEENIKHVLYALIFYKRITYIKNKVMEYLLPAIFAFAILGLCIILSSLPFSDLVTKTHPLKIDLASYGKTTVYFNHTQEPDVVKMGDFYEKLVQSRGSFSFNLTDVSDAIIRQGEQNIQYYRRHMVASAEFMQSGNELQITALYNALAKHSAPISLNLITNALAKSLLGEEYSISLTNLPLRDVGNDDVKTFSDIQISILWLLILPIGLTFFAGTFIYFPYSEISTNFVQLQLMCGIPSWLYWMCMWIFDYLLYLVFAIIIAGISMFWTPFSGLNEFHILLQMLCLYGLSGIPFAYLFSRKKSLASSYSAFIISGIICGIIPCLAVMAMKESGNDWYIYVGERLEILFLIFDPPFIFTDLGIKFSSKAMEKYKYKNMEYGQKMAYCGTNKNHPCCVGNQSCSTLYKDIVDAKTILPVFFGLLFFIFVNIMLNSYKIQKICNGTAMKIRRIFKNHTENKQCALCDSTTQNFFNVKSLQKSFDNNVASHVCFGLDKGQCMGLLGVNGAGKSTAFRMLTRDEIKDSGKISIAQGTEKDKDYLEYLGYCPQYDSLNGYLTGRQMLCTMAMLRRLKNTDDIVNNMLDIFELQSISDKPCRFYSGGNKRKLSFAISILGLPDVILLDEPTNGVDSSTRRKFWSLIRKLKDEKKTAFVLTSHSMSECEAVCNNVQIMKSGTIKKNGSISQLRSQQGFTVKFKLNTKRSPETVEEVDMGSESIIIRDINSLKEHLKEKYDGEVKDEHPGYLQYYIKTTTRKWSELFREFDKLQSYSNGYIEDYILTNASLEDIFIDLAKG